MPQDAWNDKVYTAIEVNTHDPETHEEFCFLIKPFRKELWEVSLAIEQAASRQINLQTRSLDLDQSPLSILSQSALNIRNARIVVAILHEREATHANPNVMYELGVAHALGKPTLIVANPDSSAQPAMTNNLQYIPLPTAEQVKDDSFFHRLNTPLTKLSQSNYNNILWPNEARLVSAGTPLLEKINKQEFMENANALYKFGTEILATFLQLGLGHVNPMTKPSLEQIIAFEPRSFKEFQTWFGMYQESFRNSADPIVYTDADTKFSKTQKHLEFICNSVSKYNEDFIDIMQRYFVVIRSAVYSFRDMHGTLTSEVERIFGDQPTEKWKPLRERDVRMYNMYATVKQMLGTCVVLIQHCNAFLTRIVDSLVIAATQKA